MRQVLNNISTSKPDDPTQPEKIIFHNEGRQSRDGARGNFYYLEPTMLRAFCLVTGSTHKIFAQCFDRWYRVVAFRDRASAESVKDGLLPIKTRGQKVEAILIQV